MRQTANGPALTGRASRRGEATWRASDPQRRQYVGNEHRYPGIAIGIEVRAPASIHARGDNKPSTQQQWLYQSRISSAMPPDRLACMPPSELSASSTTDKRRDDRFPLHGIRAQRTNRPTRAAEEHKLSYRASPVKRRKVGSQRGYTNHNMSAATAIKLATSIPACVLHSGGSSMVRYWRLGLSAVYDVDENVLGVWAAAWLVASDPATRPLPFEIAGCCQSYL